MGNLIKGVIYIPGGVLSPGDLRRITGTANKFGTQFLHIGDRQEMILQFRKRYEKDFSTRFNNTQYYYESGDIFHQNIISSYPVKNITPSLRWLTEGIYREVLGSFNYQPKLKINIIDPTQGMSPAMSGDLNFIGSEYENYWFLYLNLRTGEKPAKWPVLIDSKEIAAISEVIEILYTATPEISMVELQEKVYSLRDWTFRKSDSQPDLSAKRFQYYEGLHPMGEKRYWLGIYERLNEYPVSFLESLCAVCQKTENNTISITPYKSLIIKNIREEHITHWEKLLGQYKINTMHSSLEVNFQVPALDRKAQQLRKFIFNYFDDSEVRSDGLVFEIKNDPEDTDLGGSVIIERKIPFRIGRWAPPARYHIKYKKDFNPNNHEMITFAGYATKSNIPGFLAYLCERYFELLSSPEKPKERKEEEENKAKLVYQCKECMTIYDSRYGDEYSGIAEGMPFEEIPENYVCPVCEAPKTEYELVNVKGYDL